jgi:His-Xaa-Ser system radical SAM maturase HxsC
LTRPSRPDCRAALFRRASKHDAFLTTERCNHYCLMCSQPPRKVNDGWILDEIAECIELIDPATETIGFTGGEPLLEWRKFIGVLAAARDRLPVTAIHVLTNGRAFASDEVASAWAAVAHPRLSAGIPLYGAVDAVHDYVVQARGAFDETLLGILRLNDKGQRVEVRVVLHAVTAPRLREICAWLARNLPFVDHIALMGLENTGFALANQDLRCVDPLDYQVDLACGVDRLRAARMNAPGACSRSSWPAPTACARCRPRARTKSARAHPPNRCSKTCCGGRRPRAAPRSCCSTKS